MAIMEFNNANSLDLALVPLLILVCPLVWKFAEIDIIVHYYISQNRYIFKYSGYLDISVTVPFEIYLELYCTMYFRMASHNLYLFPIVGQKFNDNSSLVSSPTNNVGIVVEGSGNITATWWRSQRHGKGCNVAATLRLSTLLMSFLIVLKCWLSWT